MPESDRSGSRVRLAAHGLRTTHPRVALLEVLASTKVPLTVGALNAALLPRGLDRATVYRNLVLLTERGVLTRSTLPDGTLRYAVAAEPPPPAHVDLTCVRCGRTEPLPPLAVVVDRALAGDVLALRVEGHCVQCRGVTSSSA